MFVDGMGEMCVRIVVYVEGELVYDHLPALFSCELPVGVWENILVRFLVESGDFEFEDESGEWL